MRPDRGTPAHHTEHLAELVCSNSFKSVGETNAHGILKAEMRKLGSLVLRCAEEARVPAGSALAVDRELFARAVTETVEDHPRIELVRKEVRELPSGPAVVATGPLTSDALSDSIRAALGDDGLSFYDAISPIVGGESVDRSVAFAAGRYGQSEDYLNCPLTEEEYERFLDALLEADVYPGHDWEAVPYFEGCLPIEVLAERGRDTLRFGPMKPVGLEDPRTGRRPHAVVQLRREDQEGRMWNLVGFQTRLRHGEQRRTFGLIPGLEAVEFLRWGGIHRNSYLNFPARLSPHGGLPERPELIFAGQLTGVEGYVESAASGILAGVNLGRLARGLDPAVPPSTTMIGALLRYLREASAGHFQPMNSNWGLVDSLSERVRKRDERRRRLAARALEELGRWMVEEGVNGIASPEGRPDPASAGPDSGPEPAAMAAPRSTS